VRPAPPEFERRVKTLLAAKRLETALDVDEDIILAGCVAMDLEPTEAVRIILRLRDRPREDYRRWVRK